MIMQRISKNLNLAIGFIIFTLVGCESQDEKIINLAKEGVIYRLMNPNSIAAKSITFSNLYMRKERLAAADGHLFIYVCGTVNVKNKFYGGSDNSRFIVIIDAEEIFSVNSVKIEALINNESRINEYDGDFSFGKDGWNILCVD